MRVRLSPARHPGHDVDLLHRIAVLANEASTLAEAVPLALDEVCTYTGWPVGHAYFIDPSDSKRLNSTSHWHLPSGGFEVLKEVSEHMPLVVGVGLPGRVLASGKPEWVENAATDENFPRAHTGRDIEVRGGAAAPVLCGREVLAVLEFFSKEPQPRDESLLTLLGHVGTQLGRVGERERAAKSLLGQVEYTKHLIDSAYDAFVSIDRDGVVTGWNAAAESMFGWRNAEVLGRSLAETIIPHRYRDAHVRGMRRFLHTGEARVLNQRLELAALHRDGREFPVEIVIWPVGANGTFTFCAFVRDITERRDMLADLLQADEQNRRSEERLVVAQQMAGVGSWEWEIDVNVVTWSEQLYRNFGLSPEEFDPSFEGYLAHVHPDDRDDVVATINRAIEDHASYEFDFRIIRPDGDVRIHHCTGRVITEDGRPVRMAGTDQDVTEQRLAAAAVQTAYEREREMVEKLTDLDEAKTRFVSSVSHELRTPLTSIIGYIQFLREIATELLPEHMDMLGVIDRNSHRLLALIEDLLTVSRIESGAFKLAVAPCDLSEIVDRVVEAMHPQALERQLDLRACVEPDIGPVRADADQLERLLLNLVSNAVKFTSEGAVAVSAYREDDEVVLVVSDTGIGIPADEVPQLFRPFFRSSNADNAAPGTGLGLVIVKAIVDEHRGSLDVSTTQGRGTTVTVRLPDDASAV